jgi:GIY-YIG catalytic domain
MNKRFRRLVDSLHPLLEQLIACEPHKKGASLPEWGVYLFMENRKPIYVGRSNNIRRRYGDHTRPSSPTSLGILMARRALEMKPDYRAGARKRLWSNPQFQKAFKKAQKRITAMEFRAVQEKNPTKQALLEVYCAVALRTPFNDFDVH